jgi:hypothetical protein
LSSSYLLLLIERSHPYAVAMPLVPGHHLTVSDLPKVDNTHVHFVSPPFTHTI